MLGGPDYRTLYLSLLAAAAAGAYLFIPGSSLEEGTYLFRQCLRYHIDDQL